MAADGSVHVLQCNQLQEQHMTSCGFCLWLPQAADASALHPAQTTAMAAVAVVSDKGLQRQVGISGCDMWVVRPSDEMWGVLCM